MSYNDGGPGGYGPGFDFGGSGNLNPSELGQFMDSYGNDIIQNGSGGGGGIGGPGGGKRPDQKPSLIGCLPMLILLAIFAIKMVGLPDYEGEFSPLFGLLHSSEAGSIESLVDYEDGGVKYKVPQEWTRYIEKLNPKDNFDTIYYEREYRVYSKNKKNYVIATFTIRKQQKIRANNKDLTEVEYYQKYGFSEKEHAVSISGAPLAYRSYRDIDLDVKGSPKIRTDEQIAFLGDLAVEFTIIGTRGFLREELLNAIFSSMDCSEFDPKAWG